MARYGTSSADWDGPWRPDDDFCSTGLGVEGEGRIIELRFHTVTGSDRVERYIAAILELSRAYSIELDKYGVQTSIDGKDSEERRLSSDQAAERMRIPDSLMAGSQRALVHPATPDRVEVWALATSDMRHFSVDDEIHFKTKGDSWLLDKFFHTKMGHFGHLEGGEVMNQMSQHANAYTDNPLPQDEQEGCDSDEWSD